MPAHPELVDAFRSVPHRSLADKVFTGRGGKPLSPRSAARWIAEGIAKAGLQEAATGTGVKGPASHSLRRSCARHWLQSGLNVNAVSAWLGHSRPTVPSTPTWCWLRTLWGTYPRFHNKRWVNHNPSDVDRCKYNQENKGLAPIAVDQLKGKLQKPKG